MGTYENTIKMIEIINIYGHILELNSSTVIPVERNNSLFNSPDKFLQDMTYPGKAGLTDNNKIFIQGGHLVEATTDKYEMDVKVSVGGSPFFAGIFIYKIVSGSISFNLKINFGAVAEKVKNISIRDIYSMDTEMAPISIPLMEARMKDSCVNPLNYPSVFFPIYNESWGPGATDHKWLNNWNHGSQKFDVVSGRSDGKNTAQVPFFRGTYILKKILECLKFNVDGGYFSDPDALNEYFFTRYRADTTIPMSLSFMPDLKISEFFKYYAERKRISLDFDVLNNRVTVETPDSVLSNPYVLDLSEYIESIDEIATAESKGYSVTLKIDDSDESWNTGSGDESVFVPPYTLHVGSSETKVEMEIGTLNSKQDTDYSYPINSQEINAMGEADPITWPLSFLEYTGMKTLPDGKLFPEAKPLNLKDSDALWYKFLNDSKPLVIYANIPPTILSKLKPTTKIGCVSNEGFYFNTLPVKINYDLTDQDTELIRVKITARTLISNFNTVSFIENNTTAGIDISNPVKFKAYYNPVVHGMTEILIKKVSFTGVTIFGNTPITSPTDELGTGGTVGTTYFISGTRPTSGNSENRLYSSVPPKYYINYGIKEYFTAHDGYYTFNGNLPIRPFDGKPVWIIF